MSDPAARPWWRDFFDADYRRIWSTVTGSARNEADLAAVVELCRRHGRAAPRGTDAAPLAGWWVADVCGGDGRIATPLAARFGAHVAVADASAAMLGARDIAAVAEPDTIPILCDARTLPLADACFDAALCLFTSLGIGTDAESEAMIGHMARVLKPGGVLILDLANRDFVASVGRVRQWYELDDGTLRLHRADFDPLTGRTDEALTEIAPDGERVVKPWSTRLFTATDVDRMLRRVGLTPVAFHAGSDLTPFEPRAPRLLVAAIRPEDPMARPAPSDPLAPTSWRDAVDRLSCPATRQPLRIATDEELAQIRDLQEEGGLATMGGEPVTESVDDALVRADGTAAYLVRNGVPVLFPDEAMPLDNA